MDLFGKSIGTYAPAVWVKPCWAPIHTPATLQQMTKAHDGLLNDSWNCNTLFSYQWYFWVCTASTGIALPCASCSRLTISRAGWPLPNELIGKIDAFAPESNRFSVWIIASANCAYQTIACNLIFTTVTHVAVNHMNIAMRTWWASTTHIENQINMCMDIITDLTNSCNADLRGLCVFAFEFEFRTGAAVTHSSCHLVEDIGKPWLVGIWVTFGATFLACPCQVHPKKKHTSILFEWSASSSFESCFAHSATNYAPLKLFTGRNAVTAILHDWDVLIIHFLHFHRRAKATLWS